MKIYLALGMGLVVSACSSYDTFNSRNGQNVTAELPGVPTEIECDPKPQYIYSKSGDLIDTVMPVRHPSCPDKVTRAGATDGSETSSGFFGGLFGPVTRTASLDSSADRVRGPSYDDDPHSPTVVAAATPTGGGTPVLTVAEETSGGAGSTPTGGTGSTPTGGSGSTPTGGSGSPSTPETSGPETEGPGHGEEEEGHGHTEGEGCVGHDCTGHDPAQDAEPWKHHPDWYAQQTGG